MCIDPPKHVRTTGGFLQRSPAEFTADRTLIFRGPQEEFDLPDSHPSLPFSASPSARSAHLTAHFSLWASQFAAGGGSSFGTNGLSVPPSTAPIITGRGHRLRGYSLPALHLPPSPPNRSSSQSSFKQAAVKQRQPAIAQDSDWVNNILSRSSIKEGQMLILRIS